MRKVTLLLFIVFLFIAIPLALVAQASTDTAAMDATNMPVVTRIVAVAAAISGFIGIVKKMNLPLPGWLALTVNIVTTAATAIMVTPPEQLLTFPFIVSLLVGVLTAAGLHDLSNFFSGKSATRKQLAG
jgi:hypothetical protein